MANYKVILEVGQRYGEGHMFKNYGTAGKVLS